MTKHQNIYTAVSRAAWGYFFMYFDFNLGSLNILPNFIAYLLFLSSIKLLKQERRDLALLRPLGILLALWTFAEWLLTVFGGNLNEVLSIVGTVIGLVSLYFHFQFVTDFAALATRFQPPGEELDRRLLRWRTIQTVLLTITSLMAYPAQWLPEWWEYTIFAVLIVNLIACICIMAALFRLRKCVGEWPTGQQEA